MFHYLDQYNRLIDRWLAGRFTILAPNETKEVSWHLESTVSINEMAFFSADSHILLLSVVVGNVMLLVPGTEIHEGMCRESICHKCGLMMRTWEEYLQIALRWFPMHGHVGYPGEPIRAVFRNLLSVEQSAAIAFKGITAQ